MLADTDIIVSSGIGNVYCALIACFYILWHSCITVKGLVSFLLTVKMIGFFQSGILVSECAVFPFPSFRQLAYFMCSY